MSYFAIEHNQEYMDHVVIHDKDGNIVFGNYLDMTYGEMKSSEDLEEFVVAVMDAAREDDSEQVLITLVGDDNIFIWSIIIGSDGDDGVKYVLVDWKKDGKIYCYES